MMGVGLLEAGERLEARQFARRAFTDFGLMEAFEARPPHERVLCLRWIEAAEGSREEERRVTRTIVTLERGEPLPGS